MDHIKNLAFFLGALVLIGCADSSHDKGSLDVGFGGEWLVVEVRLTDNGGQTVQSQFVDSDGRFQNDWAEVYKVDQMGRTEIEILGAPDEPTKKKIDASAKQRYFVSHNQLVVQAVGSEGDETVAIYDLQLLENGRFLLMQRREKGVLVESLRLKRMTGADRIRLARLKAPAPTPTPTPTSTNALPTASK